MTQQKQQIGILHLCSEHCKCVELHDFSIILKSSAKQHA